MMPGTSSIVANASRPPTQPVSGSVAMTVAVRGASRSRAISPTISPGVSSTTVSLPSKPIWVTSAPPGRDKQKRHRELTLLHQHLPGRGGQRPQLRREWDQGLSRSSGKGIQRGQIGGADCGQAGHDLRLRRFAEVGQGNP